EVDGQRGENTRLSYTARAVRLSGLRVRAMLLERDGTSLSGYAAVKEEPQTDHRGGSRVHRPSNDVAGGRGIGVASQWKARGLVQLLFVGSGQQSLPCDRAVHQVSAASVVMRQAQSG